jgi:signal transduction histidine kinase
MERKRAEQQLRQLNKEIEKRVDERTAELQESNDALRESEGRYRTVFVNVVSHERRTPLGVIMSSADILESYFERLKPEQRAGYLQDIQHSTKQMTGLMEEVLLLGRVESGKMECRPELIDLNSFCQRLVDEQRSATHEKCPILFTPGPFAGEARGDEGVMRHIFSNLLSNAIKYSSAKSPVHFSVKRDAAKAVFEVREHGIGIPAEDQKRLFEAFHRGQNVGEISGTGLGMVIVKRCIDMHQGTIELTSVVGRGTTFIVQLNLFSQETAAPITHKLKRISRMRKK